MKYPAVTKSKDPFHNKFSFRGASDRSDGSLLVVVDNDADTRALGAGTELDLGALLESNFGELEGAVEAGEISLLDGDSGGDLLA